jgi:glycosyltransferase involved in cell wall biosynthesis
MIIGVDAGALSVTDDRLKVGVYRVIYNLLKELSVLDTENLFRLYAFSPIDSDLINEFSPRMESFVVTPKEGWFSIRLPFSLLIHPVDLFLGVSQAIPVGFFSSIGFIYDVGFLSHPKLYPGSATKLKNQTREVARRARHIVTISEASKKDIQTYYGIKAEKITVAYPGVDERFTKAGSVFKGISPYFLHVGSLKKGKNIPTLIRAFAEFRKRKETNAVLLIIGGDYWMDETIHTTIKETGMEEYVRLLGYMPDAILPEYYRGATAFVTSSITEGFCLPVAEAMACGCPVIAPNTASFPEVVAEESLLYPVDDINSCAALMEKITSDSSIRDVAIAKGIAKTERYNWKKFAETIYATYSSMASK